MFLMFPICGLYSVEFRCQYLSKLYWLHKLCKTIHFCESLCNQNLETFQIQEGVDSAYILLETYWWLKTISRWWIWFLFSRNISCLVLPKWSWVEHHFSWTLRMWLWFFCTGFLAQFSQWPLFFNFFQDSLPGISHYVYLTYGVVVLKNTHLIS